MTEILNVSGVSKTFSGTRVLSDAGFTLQEGEVRALLGQNGSGKSTLIKILSGYHAPDPGARMTVRSEQVALPLRPDQARELGFGFVHQDLALADSMSVTDNLLVGRYASGRGGRIPWRREHARVRKHLTGLGIDLEPTALVETLTDVERALLAIARALIDVDDGGRRVLVLDEATAFLPRDGVEMLMAAVDRIRSAGHAVLLVTHRLDEVWTMADTVTILRNGEVVGSGPLDSYTRESLVETIVGFELGELYPEHVTRGSGDAALELRGLKNPQLELPGLTVHKGEIVGLTGLVGMGWEELPYVLSGLRSGSAMQGTIRIGDRTVAMHEWSIRDALDAGIALIPADRVRTAGVPEATITENVTIATIAQSTRFRSLFLDPRKDRKRAGEIVNRLGVVPADPRRALGTLSGGNQQKVVIGKWLASDPGIVILHEPTQGVDVGARQQIFRIIQELSDQGVAVLMVSAEYQDLAAMCDRVLVVRNGRLAQDLCGSQLTEERIAQVAFDPGDDASVRSGTDALPGSPVRADDQDRKDDDAGADASATHGSAVTHELKGVTA